MILFYLILQFLPLKIIFDTNILIFIISKVEFFGNMGICFSISENKYKYIKQWLQYDIITHYAIFFSFVLRFELP